MDYVRRAYGVPAKRGGAILYDGDGRLQEGRIMSASGAYLRVHFKGEPAGRRHTLHPTWHVNYLNP